MFGRLRGLRRTGPVGALVLAVTVGAVTGMIALNVVLAGWTYRDGARRDLREPGRWALAVLLGGPLAFVPYSALQWYRDRSEATDRPERAPTRGPEPEQVGTPVERAGENSNGARQGTDEFDAGTRRPDSLASASVHYGGKAASLGARGARWVGRRAVARINNG
jgi:hypothetical protein